MNWNDNFSAFYLVQQFLQEAKRTEPSAGHSAGGKTDQPHDAQPIIWDRMDRHKMLQCSDRA